MPCRLLHRRRSFMPRYAGFTLVELLVVIAIIGTLVSLMLPAVQSARAATRRTQCQHHLRQQGIALHAYHAVHNRFPTGCLEWRRPGHPKNRQLAWSTFLLPHLEQQPLFDRLDLSLPFDSPANAEAAAERLAVFQCPQSSRGQAPWAVKTGSSDSPPRGPCDYGGIYGERIVSRNNPPSGCMLYDTAVTKAHITDGLSNTLILGEDSRFPDGEWINGRNIFDQAFAINAAPDWENDIRSEHTGGAFAARADGSVAFWPESTHLRVLAALCTRNGGDVAAELPADAPSQSATP